jgi:hypothetical protein
MDAGAGEVFVHFLEEFDTGVKECGAWGLFYIVKHSAGNLLILNFIHFFRFGTACFRLWSSHSFTALRPRTRSFSQESRSMYIS